MDETMTLTVADIVISELTTLYSDQATFNADKLSVIVSDVIDEVGIHYYNTDSRGMEMGCHMPY